MRDNEFTQNALEATIRIGLVVLLVVWCFQIVQPFVSPILWGIILAIAVYPTHRRVRGLLGDRPGMAALLLTLAILVIVVWPAVLLIGRVLDNVQSLSARWHAGTLSVPPPPPGIEAWPVIGPRLAKFWGLASTNLASALQPLGPQIRQAGAWLLGIAAETGLAIVQFVAAVIIAGVFLAYSEGAQVLAWRIGRRIGGERGAALVDLGGATMRSVARGVLGVAIIQSSLAGVGYFAVGLPAAGLWTLASLVLAVLQIGVGPVLIGAVIYEFAKSDMLTAILFLAWCIFVSVIDNILRPLLLGRGVDVPLVVIFMGAIGGMLASGIIGLFVGAVVLALGYKLFLAWLETDVPSTLGPL